MYSVLHNDMIHVKKDAAVRGDHGVFAIGVKRVGKLHCGDFIQHHHESFRLQDSQAFGVSFCLMGCKPLSLLISMPAGLSVGYWASGKHILLHSHSDRAILLIHFPGSDAE